ncbi:MarC family protein [Vibrio quintilis]|uniref:UPF0056 membrane protein n=1 Tax=Vibrio quintilis TaxID=1117707 RepID=A0A1M7YZW3_9VIBR|nr:MarC family protein [Vibrio quintilis]SHO58135.1 inner membrane protein [Vibrio quintilis]
MDQFMTHILSVFMGFFAMMNPIANTPVFLGLTAEETPEERKKVACRALVVSFLIIFVFAAAGKVIFDLFGITLPAFRITGGILIGLVGYHMLQGGEHSSIQHPSEEDKKKSSEALMSIAVSPLAMPILAGPGTIATAMNFSSSGGIVEFAVTMVSFLMLCIISYVFFVSGEKFISYIGDNGVKVITRLMGLILAVIGVQMLIGGIGGAVTYLQLHH